VHARARSRAAARHCISVCAAFFLLPSKSSGEVGVLTSVVVFAFVGKVRAHRRCLLAGGGLTSRAARGAAAGHGADHLETNQRGHLLRRLGEENARGRVAGIRCAAPPRFAPLGESVTLLSADRLLAERAAEQGRPEAAVAQAEEGVSAWRKLFIANRWNELQVCAHSPTRSGLVRAQR
jgi:hypothetical protein